MENVVLTIHLIIAVILIGVVLLQRSEGGALFGGGSVVTGRGAATALSKLTWGLAATFFATSLVLTVLAARRSAEESVLDRIGTVPPAAETPASPAAPGAELPPVPATDGTPAAPLAPAPAPAEAAPSEAAPADAPPADAPPAAPPAATPPAAPLAPPPSD
jgi:preprotein translocase subunit SecG